MWLDKVILALCMSTFLKPASAGENKIIADYYGNVPTNPEPCIITCTGSTGHGTTTWSNGLVGEISTIVDMSKCGFVTIPSVTTNLEGISELAHFSGMTSVYSMGVNSFKVWVIGPVWSQFRNTGWSYALSANVANNQKLNVMWTATGYVC